MFRFILLFLFLMHAIAYKILINSTFYICVYKKKSSKIKIEKILFNINNVTS